MQAIGIKGNSDINPTSDAASFYKEYWQSGEVAASDNIQRNNAVLAAFFPNGIKNKKIVEIGVGGAGGMIGTLAADNQVIGLDVSESAQKCCERLGLPILLHNVNDTALPIENETVDILFAFEVFEHFASPQFVVEEIRRVLKPDGILILSTPHTLTHHWPRLFYPALFERDAFEEFLMVNGFETVTLAQTGPPVYKHLLKGDDKVNWSWLWNCRKLSTSDSSIYKSHGYYFWNKTTAFNLRLRPMEAIDCFRTAWQFDPLDTEARLMLALSLSYRYVAGETKEFLEHFNFLNRILNSPQEPFRVKAQYVFALMFLEFDKIGRQHIGQKDYEQVLHMLSQTPEGQSYLSKIQAWNEGTPFYL